MADALEKVLPEAAGNSGDYHGSDGTVVKNVKAVAYGSITALDVAESPAQTQNMDNDGETP
ncbi:MAG: hypothetical protein ACR5LG_03095 [Sodalis sp. (in: enterobacteria)]|uniref:hypothetical protein n=1 Tax=Sodalis sp. (in: enterobacteria) TaxID=1898979 RepID=UPI003F3AB2BD